jgi:hypothetical protein
VTWHLGSVAFRRAARPNHAPAQVCSALLLPHGFETDNRYLIVERRRPRRQSVTRAMICVDRVHCFGGSHVPLMSHGVETT